MTTIIVLSGDSGSKSFMVDNETISYAEAVKKWLRQGPPKVIVKGVPNEDTKVAIQDMESIGCKVEYVKHIYIEQEVNIKVFPCASWTNSECFPCIAVEVIRNDQKPLRTWVDLKQIGKHFDSPESAMQAAKQVRVISVSEDGEVEWSQNI
jgi:hypothetical protein